MTGVIVNKLQTIQRSECSQKVTFFSKIGVKIDENMLIIESSLSNDLVFFNLPTFIGNWINQHIRKRKINLILVEPEIGEAKLKNLADVCHRSQKPVFLSLPHASELPHQHNAIAWMAKRTFDWLAALVILITLSPVLMVLAIIIAGTSSGSVFFHQWRVGESGKLFRIIKFRTMIADADKLHHLVMCGQNGLHKCEDDPRITSVGKWMRKYSLDELPQLFNVLRGEMSLVGPRPWALYDALRINGDGKRRLNSLPGVTGAWQVSARSTMLDLDAVTECDLSYLRNWTLWSDLKILLMTVPKVLSGFGAC